MVREGDARGGYPFRAEFCAPAKGWEKGSVEGGVKYVRNLVFRPRLAVESWAALNAAIITELEADLPMRHLDDGRSVEEALAQEREHLRAMPAHLPATCRVVARVADKFRHVHVDRVTYSVPIRHAYRPVWVKLLVGNAATLAFVARGAVIVAMSPFVASTVIAKATNAPKATSTATFLRSHSTGPTISPSGERITVRTPSAPSGSPPSPHASPGPHTPGPPSPRPSLSGNPRTTAAGPRRRRRSRHTAAIDAPPQPPPQAGPPSPRPSLSGNPRTTAAGPRRRRRNRRTAAPPASPQPPPQAGPPSPSELAPGQPLSAPPPPRASPPRSGAP